MSVPMCGFFPGHIYIENHSPCLLPTCFYSINASWSTAWLSCDQSINFLDEHGILTQEVCCFFYDTPGRFYVIVYATPESVINILEIVGSDNWTLDSWSGAASTWPQW